MSRPMTDEEICREYRLAKYPGKQVKILAEENGCSMGTIYNILRANGVQFKSDRTAGKKGDDSNMETKTSPGKEPAAPAQEPPWSPLPAAPPQAAADFDDLGPSSLPDVQDIPEASAAPGREAEYVRDWRGLLRTLADNVRATCILSPESGAEPAEAEESGNIYRISRADLSRMWHILGRLQGVLEVSAEAGKPGEVMKDACDELEVILCGIQQDAG